MIPPVHQNQREVRTQAVRDFVLLKEREEEARKQPTSCGPNRGPLLKTCGACNVEKLLGEYDAATVGVKNICRDCSEHQRAFKPNVKWDNEPQVVATLDIKRAY
jgi:hypothetical protein